MANPTPYTTLMSQLGKVEANALKHAQAATTHSQRHIEAKDAERTSKAAAKRAAAINRRTGG